MLRFTISYSVNIVSVSTDSSQMCTYFYQDLIPGYCWYQVSFTVMLRFTIWDSVNIPSISMDSNQMCTYFFKDLVTGYSVYWYNFCKAPFHYLVQCEHSLNLHGFKANVYLFFQGLSYRILSVLVHFLRRFVSLIGTV